MANTGATRELDIALFFGDGAVATSRGRERGKADLTMTGA